MRLTAEEHEKLRDLRNACKLVTVAIAAVEPFKNYCRIDTEPIKRIMIGFEEQLRSELQCVQIVVEVKK